MLKSIKHDSSSSAVKDWEDAGELLANALSGYLNSCTRLENLVPDIDVSLAQRIDSSLNLLHTQLSHKLGQSRAILARMRNSTLSQFHSLPNEIIAAIFMNAVYAPAPKDSHKLPMARALSIITGRLFRLLSVCSSWRNIGINLSELWLFVPLGANGQKYPSREVTSLFLERSRVSLPQDRPLHLAALLSQGYDLHVPIVDGQVPRFTSVNIQSTCVRGIDGLINEFLKCGPPTTWSELSIHQLSKPSQDRPVLPSLIDFLDVESDPGLLLSLTSSLSILRVRGANLRWDQIIFSNKLVELHLQSVVLGHSPELSRLLLLLQSAPELQTLKFISVVAFPSAPATIHIPSVTFSFPNLRSLLLSDLDFNVLYMLLHSFAPGSLNLTLFLTGKSILFYEANDIPGNVGIQPVCGLLGGFRVNTLLLEGVHGKQAWLDGTELRGILQSLPTLETLKMARWRFNTEDLVALKHPQSEGSSSPPTPFPNLTKLSLIGCQISDPGTLSHVIASHPLQSIELGGGWYVDNNAPHEIHPDLTPLGHFTDSDPLVQQFRSTVPHVRLFGSELEVEDFNQDVWPLW